MTDLNEETTFEYEGKQYDIKIPQPFLDNESWTLWIHPDGNDWTIKGYKKIYEMKSIQDFFGVYNYIIKISSFINVPVFFMKNNILPLWEDEPNSKGGVMSFKIDTRKAQLIWKECCMALIGRYLSHRMDIINGLSMSPKSNCCVLKIWFSENVEFEDKKKIFDETFHLNGIDFNKGLFRSYS